MDYYLSLLLGLLLSISEILPYIQTIKSNGIVNFLQLSLNKQREIGNNLLEQIESEHLIVSDQSSEHLMELPNQQLLLEISKINPILNNITNSILTVNQNNFSLKTPDEYQLIYIEHCLKNDFTKNLKFKYISDQNADLLHSLGYKIEYIHNEKKYFIHW